jgi:alkylation response protein AidB-like acyl-CoA dehydrogenase
VEDSVDLALVRETARDFLSCPRGDAEIAGIGWTGLLVTEDRGGSGWRPVEATDIGAELGRARAATAWAGTVVVAGALDRWASTTDRERWLPGLLDGSSHGAVCVAGHAPIVGVPDVVVVCAPDGLHVVDGAVVETEPDLSAMDLEREVRRLATPLTVGPVVGGAAASRTVTALLRTLLAADAIGALSAARERLVEHLRTRVAFDQPLASFQALQHRLVDLLVLELRSQAIISRAAREAAAGDPAFPRTGAAAHAHVMGQVVQAVDECVQLSGGIGFTWEYPLHRELRRVLADAVLGGTARASRACVAEEGGW